MIEQDIDMATVHKSPKNKRYGKPTKRSKPIAETAPRTLSNVYAENSKRRMNQARDLAKPHRHR